MRVKIVAIYSLWNINTSARLSKSKVFWVEKSRAQIENFGPIWNFLTQYILCSFRQDKSFDGKMSIHNEKCSFYHQTICLDDSYIKYIESKNFISDQNFRFVHDQTQICAQFAGAHVTKINFFLMDSVNFKPGCKKVSKIFNLFSYIYEIKRVL